MMGASSRADWAHFINPDETSYENILRIFWEGHDPTQGMRQGNDVGTQYRSAILAEDEAQRLRAEVRDVGGPLLASYSVLFSA